MKTRSDDKPSISIALCTYNGAQYLHDQLNSIAAQTRLPDELVLCDDRSSDATIDIVTKFAAKAPFDVHFSSNPSTLGSTKNFEHAIGLCKGDLIFLCDQDDIWLPRKISTIESIFSNDPRIDGVFSDADVVDEMLSSLGYTLWKSVSFSRAEQRAVQNGRALDVFLRHNVVTGTAFAFRSRWRDFLLPIPPFGVHDAWIALLLAAAGTKIHALPEQLVRYRQHQDNQIGAKQKTLFQRFHAARRAASKNATELLNQTTEAVARLRHFPGDIPKRAMERMEKKRMHLEARICVINGAENWPRIFIRESLTGSYHRYSMGWMSMAHDLLRRTAQAGSTE